MKTASIRRLECMHFFYIAFFILHFFCSFSKTSHISILNGFIDNLFRLSQTNRDQTSFARTLNNQFWFAINLSIMHKHLKWMNFVANSHVFNQNETKTLAYTFVYLYCRLISIQSIDKIDHIDIIILMNWNRIHAPHYMLE